MSTITDYPTAARSIALNLQQFCNEEFPYPEMIADAARKAAKRIEELEEEVKNYKRVLKLSEVPQLIVDFPGFIKGCKPTEADIKWAEEAITRLKNELLTYQSVQAD